VQTFDSNNYAVGVTTGILSLSGIITPNTFSFVNFNLGSNYIG